MVTLLQFKAIKTEPRGYYTLSSRNWQSSWSEIIVQVYPTPRLFSWNLINFYSRLALGKKLKIER
jgi:hypothetical protein